MRSHEQKDRLFALEQEVWQSFGYSQSWLDAMKSQSFWDSGFDRIPDIDAALLRKRGLYV